MDSESFERVEPTDADGVAAVEIVGSLVGSTGMSSDRSMSEEEDEVSSPTELVCSLTG